MCNGQQQVLNINRERKQINQLQWKKRQCRQKWLRAMKHPHKNHKNILASRLISQSFLSFLYLSPPFQFQTFPRVFFCTPGNLSDQFFFCHVGISVLLSRVSYSRPEESGVVKNRLMNRLLAKLRFLLIMIMLSNL